MSKGIVLDIAHISFLDMIKEIISQSGPANAKGTLMRNAVKAAEQINAVEYATFEDYLATIENTSNPIAMIEGKSSHEGEFVFGLKDCPFGQSISNYKQVFDKLPEGFEEFTEEYNKSGNFTNKHHTGEGAGVSPFCSVHQPMRSALAEKIKIDGKTVQIYQLGCKAGSGKKGFAEKWIQETGVSKDLVDKVLDSNMCCYYLKIIE